MSDTSPPIWESSAHTLAKHRILENYLKAWVPIMARQSHKLGISKAELLFVDGFAGPGRYAGGEPGSPILAIESVLEHSYEFPIPISFLFIEEHNERHAILQNIVEDYRKRIGESRRISSVRVEKGDCERVLNEILDIYEKTKRKIGPAFFFLDQSGYSDVSLQLIQRVMSQPQCEVFSYLNWDHMNRFLGDKTKWPSLDRTFGGPEWRPALGLESNERSVFTLGTYKTALEKKSGSKYVWHFAMCDTNDKLLYWLFFCTNSLRGLELMKRAMWKVDPGGGFRFSDKDNPSQLNLFRDYQDEMLAEDLSVSLEGKVRTVSQVKEIVLTQTPAYTYTKALKLLEKEHKLIVINPPPRRRKGTFAADDMQLKFLPDSHPRTSNASDSDLLV
ncbi:MAG: three-Cys-motif partner protein TcmP [Planctomycetota bacterium]